MVDDYIKKMLNKLIEEDNARGSYYAPKAENVFQSGRGRPRKYASTEAALEAKREYRRKWYQDKKDRQKEYNKMYYEKRKK